MRAVRLANPNSITISASCTHSIDQGAICHNDENPTRMALPTCRGWAATGAMGGTNLYGQSGNSVAPILFGCIDFYSVTI